MKTRLLMIIGIIAVTGMAISLAYYVADSMMTSKTKQECDMGIHREQYSLDFGNVTYRNHYVIKNGCVDGILHNKDMNSLVVNFYKTKNGMIQIMLPEFLYDLRPISEHVVLSDGEEIAFEQLAPSALLIDFTENTKTIEIIDSKPTSDHNTQDSLKIPNTERDAKLAAGYKLYPGIGWVHPDDLGNQQPKYRNNPNNPEELVLDIDAMIKEYDSSVSQCLSFFHCDASKDTFQDCIGAKKDGITIEQLCFDSKVTTDAGCTTIEFPDDASITRCR